ncbi:gamma-glutamyltransferase family protein [Liquorilactobacillus satsumensis]|uniref:gamma-glutamyltransferase family protein n=1 Tax=Liquorilactobacillus satsumensis TaxID=259059 RepID=UPI0039E7F44D
MFSIQNQPFESFRQPVLGTKGMVATSQPLAAQAGLSILKQGGNAVDAAIATAACLTVVEPTSNGIGSDCFAIIEMHGRLYGLNSSGYAPEKLTINSLKSAGFSNIPRHGIIPITIPGTPAGWAACSERFGNLSLDQVLQPAIHYAEEGFPVSPTVALLWRKAAIKFTSEFRNEAFEEWFKVFMPNGRFPRTGDIWKSPDHARTLRKIAKTNAKTFYHGEIADKIVTLSNRFSGFIKKRDLVNFKPQWVNPLKIDYHGYQIWELPPNSQGILTLMALNTLKHCDFSSNDEVANIHYQIEAFKSAIEIGKNKITDEKQLSLDFKKYLSNEFGQKSLKKIDDVASQLTSSIPNGGTVYLATADSSGNMVSFIQSNFQGFGSGIVVPGTGIALQNRGASFSLNTNDINVLAPLKKPFHTLMPGFISKNDQFIGPFGVMGGDMQAQGHLQIIINLIDRNLNPQAAIDAPRWRWMSKKKVNIEKSFPYHIALGLEERQHDVSVDFSRANFGRAQIIWRKSNGVFVGGTESRGDGTIAAW